MHIDKDLRIFQQNQLNLINPRILYDTRYFTRNNQLYRQYREALISATGKEIATMNLVNTES